MTTEDDTSCMKKFRPTTPRVACTECGENVCIKLGMRMTKKGKCQRWQCQACGHVQYDPIKETA